MYIHIHISRGFARIALAASRLKIMCIIPKLTELNE